MLVYGDRSRPVGPRQRLADIANSLRTTSRAADSNDRREEVTRAFILAAELAQGLADEAFNRRGEDAAGGPSQAALALVRSIADACFGLGSLAGASAEAYALAGADLPDSVRIKVAEGHAFYAVYPQAYWLAAARTQWDAAPLVIGLRSIGTGLAAVVAAAAKASLLISVRPVGHPFHRELRLAAKLARLIRAHRGPVAIVDEGPGLSGSSFGAVADCLRSLGLASERLILFPSHPGEPGPAASSTLRRSWRSARREVVTLDDLLEQEPIGAWFADLIGAPRLTEDLSGGCWRDERGPPSRPPAWTSRERRKFRLTTDSGRYLARFAGLGASGEAAFARATALNVPGFVPEPIALRRGFLLERWIEGGVGAGDRPRLIRQLGDYIAFRALAFPAAAHQGASPNELRTMALRNAGELGGAALSARVAHDVAGLEAFAASLMPMHVDGRLHAWEWRRDANGAFLKCDAVDHCADHDLVGCQDQLWDVAGAVVEHQLTATETWELLAAVGEQDQTSALAKLAIFARLYAAFQGGYWAMAAQTQSGQDAALCRAQIARYLPVLEAAAWAGG